jgi:hypothetical protein
MSRAARTTSKLDALDSANGERSNVTRGTRSASPNVTHFVRDLNFLGSLGPLMGPLGSLVTPGDEEERGPRITLTHEAVAKLMNAFGAGDDDRFPCPIPGHTGRASLVFEDGDWWLQCCLGRKRSPAEAVAVKRYGRDRMLSNIELAT